MRFVRTGVIIAAVFFMSCGTLQPAKDRIEVDIKELHYPAGTVEGQFDNLLAREGLSKLEIGVSYYPLDDVLCLQFRYNFTTHYQFWDRSHRAAFVSALQQYKTDYQERNLNRNNQRTKRAYSTERLFLVWESSQFSQQGFSHPNAELGYRFKTNSPYFTVTMRDERNENEITKEIMPFNSNIIMYFTRAQADDVALLFDQNYLHSLGPTTAPARQTESIEEDFYSEGDF